MDDAERLAFQGLYKTKALQNKIKSALTAIEENYIPGHSHVAFSCGKDSLVVLDLVRQIDPSVPALFCSTEQKNYMDNYEFVCNSLSEDGAIIRETMLTPLNWKPKKSIRDILNPPEDDICYLGLRKQESKVRRISLSRFGISHTYKSGGKRVCPIANWTNSDVWAYIYGKGLPYLSFYDSVPKTSPKGRTSVFLGTGHSNTPLAVESRYYVCRHNHHFQLWEESNPDIVDLMRLFWQLKSNVIDHGRLLFKLSEARRKQLDRLCGITYFHEAKQMFPYLSMAAWCLYKEIKEINNDETPDSIIDQLRP
jgi:phosphoadenosine phosphosulfate reductase